LYMSVGLVADPDVFPRRGDHQFADSLKGGCVGHRLSPVGVGEPILRGVADDAGHAIADVQEVGDRRSAFVIFVDTEKLLVRKIKFDGLCFHTYSFSNAAALPIVAFLAWYMPALIEKVINFRAQGW